MARYSIDPTIRDKQGRQCGWDVVVPDDDPDVAGERIGTIDTSDHGYQAWTLEGDPVGLPVLRRELAAETLWRRDVRDQLRLALGRAGADDYENLDQYNTGLCDAFQTALDVLSGKERIR